MPTACKTNKIAIWLKLARAKFFTVSLIPVILGGMLALESAAQAQWRLFPIVMLCALFFHAGTNIVNEYFDFSKGVDNINAPGPKHVLVEGLLLPRQALTAGIGLFVLGFLLGLIIVSQRGLLVFLLGIIGIVGGYCYTGWPVGFKYQALGNFGVFLLMGPLLVIASYISLTGTYSPKVLYASLPIGFLVTAILHANNLRDIKQDREAGVKTLENILGFKKAKLGYFILVWGAYAAVAVMIVSGMLSLWTSLVFLTFPWALQNMRLLKKSKSGNPQDFAALDLLTARLHLFFGVILILSLGLKAILQ